MEQYYFNDGTSYYEPTKATGWLIATYIVALLGGWLAIVFGFRVYFAKVEVDGDKVPKYIQSHRTLGLIGGILGVVSLAIWKAVVI